MTVTDNSGNVVEVYQVDPSGITFGSTPDATEALPQASYVSWTRRNHDQHNLLDSADRYHDIPSSGLGSSGTHYYRTSYESTAEGAVWKVAGPATVKITQFDPQGRRKAIWTGVDATDATEADPDGSGNDMVKVQEFFYDGATTSTLAVGNGNLTRTVNHADSSTSYTTNYQYDWRNRLEQTRHPGDSNLTEQRDVNNLGWVTVRKRYADADTDWEIDGTELLTREDAAYDDLGRVYASTRYKVVTGTASDTLTNETWYGGNGQIIKTADASGLFKKLSYDSIFLGL